MNRSHLSRSPSLLGLLGLLALAPLGGCSPVETGELTSVKGPAFGSKGDDFRPVSAVVERRCATLDCHGSPERPLRIYGQYGLRLVDPDTKADAGHESGGLDPTSLDELTANFQSMTALEPELLNRVVSDKGKPETLTLVRKPRLLEKHKGGLLWNKGDDGDTCVINWLTGVDDTSPCDTEVLHP